MFDVKEFVQWWVVVLLSGGFDLMIVLVMVFEEGFEVYVLLFFYGQCYDVEFEVVKVVVVQFGICDYCVVQIDLCIFGGLVLIDDIEVFKGCDVDEEIEIFVIYVLVCNMIFLLFVMVWVEVLEVLVIFFGVNVLDYFGYLDCCLEYIEVFQSMVNLVM